MNDTFKNVCRFIVGGLLILLGIVAIVNFCRTVVWPSLPVRNGGEYVVDISGAMSEPDKTYAYNAISKAARENKVAIVLDYELTTFEITDSYIDRTVNSLVDKVYRNTPYVVYTYFADTDKLVINTNIDDVESRIVDVTKEEVASDAQVVKEVLYYQQNLNRAKHGIKMWNWNLVSGNVWRSWPSIIGALILFILGWGVVPKGKEWKFFKSEKGTHKEG